MTNDSNNNRWEHFQDFSDTKFYDPWGYELQAAKCEYCGVTKPIQLFETDDGDAVPFHIPNLCKTLMIQIKIGVKRRWVCSDCLKDMKNRQ
jgi:hypothetical protein